MAVFWDVAPCSLVEIDRRFRGAFCLHHQAYDPDDAGTPVNTYQTTRCNIPEGSHFLISLQILTEYMLFLLVFEFSQRKSCLCLSSQRNKLFLLPNFHSVFQVRMRTIQLVTLCRLSQNQDAYFNKTSDFFGFQ
jgi:hypothetical protein